MFPASTRTGAFQATVDRNLLIAQGATVGGSTVINNAIWLHADLDRLLPRWEQAGAYIDRQRIERGYEAIERLLKVAAVPAKYRRRERRNSSTAREHIGLEASLLQNNASTASHAVGATMDAATTARLRRSSPSFRGRKSWRIGDRPGTRCAHHSRRRSRHWRDLRSESRRAHHRRRPCRHRRRCHRIQRDTAPERHHHGWSGGLTFSRLRRCARDG